LVELDIVASRAAWALVVLVIAVAAPKFAEAAADAQGETVVQTICRLVENAAAQHSIPVPFLTRLIWQESTFRADVTSRAGAQGIAQFMPGTARERGLADPFDPEQAIPAAAFLLSDLRRTFGNLGLAAAAYNGGPGRVSTWLAGRGGLPDETRDYVARITGRSADDWSSERTGGPSSTPSTQPEQGLLTDYR
jgi:soluble lytic murein transglycosylase-like protein